MPRQTKHSRASLVAAIREFHQSGGAQTSTAFLTHKRMSSSTLAKFGGWGSLKAEAMEGLPDVIVTSEEEDARAVREHQLREKTRAARTESRAIIRHLEKNVKELEEIRDFLLGVTDLTKEWTPYPITAGPKKALPEATYVMLASDWHVGERVRPEQIGGRNEYNPDIAQERGDQFWKSNITMLNAARAAWHVPKICLWLGGDLITGYIHEEYEADNFLSPTEETLLAFRMMVSGIEHLLRHSDAEEILIATSNGNHGRTTKKKRVVDDFRNSYEFMLYQLLALHFQNEDRIKFQLGTGYYNIVDLYGFKVRFSHGDAVRSGGGVGGLGPPLYRRIGKLAESGNHVGIDCMGHHHQLDFLRCFVRNGSLIGWNQFAEFLGCSPEPAQQASFIVDSKHQIACNFNPILVERKRGK